MLKKTLSYSLALFAILPLAASCTDATVETLGETTSPLFSQGVAAHSARFMVKNGSMCIAAPLSGNGPVVQLPCASHPRFWWVAEPDTVADPTGANRMFKIHNQGRCLDVPFGDTGSQVGLNTYPCSSSTQQNQQFRFNRVHAPNGAIVIGEYEIQPRLAIPNNLCLDIRTGTTAAGNQLQQFPCTGGANQRFLLRPRLYQHAGLDCDVDDVLEVQTSIEFDTVPGNTIVNFPAGTFNTIRMTCDGDTETRTCRGATAEIDRLRGDEDEYTFTCWE